MAGSILATIAPDVPPIPTTLKGKKRLVANELYTTLTMSRHELLSRLIDRKHHIDEECGYPFDFAPQEYRYLYDREAIACRVVQVYPEESWAVNPEIWETTKRKNTNFEKSFLDLEEKRSIFSYLQRIDDLSGIAFYGVLLLGVDDGEELDVPLKGVGADGLPYGKTPNYKLLFLRAFDETLVRIQTFEHEPDSPRYGQPTMYSIRFVDLTTGIPEAVIASEKSWRRVHWTRCIHVVDNRKSGEVFGQPRMRPVINRLIDLRKVYGGAGEMFWKGGFPGYSFEIAPDVAAEVELDQSGKEELRRELSAYSNGLQRYLALVGVSAKSLSVQVADPKSHIDIALQAICIQLGVPQRVFIGSEEARLASSQDSRTWNRRLAKRQNSYLSPWLIRPFIDRCIMLGILPRPKNYKITWADLNTPTDADKADMAVKRTQAWTYLVQSGTPITKEVLTVLMRLSPSEAEMLCQSLDGEAVGMDGQVNGLLGSKEDYDPIDKDAELRMTKLATGEDSEVS